MKEALLDPLTWAFVFYALTADIPNGGISNFFSQLVGFSLCVDMSRIPPKNDLAYDSLADTA